MSQGTHTPPDYLFTQQALLRETAKMIALRKGEFPFNQCYHFAPVHPFIPASITYVSGLAEGCSLSFNEPSHFYTCCFVEKAEPCFAPSLNDNSR